MSMQRTHFDAAPIPLPNGIRDSLSVSSRHGHRGRSSTPIGRPIPANTHHLMNTIEGDLGAEEDPRLAVFRELYAKSEARLNALLGNEAGDGSVESAVADQPVAQQHEEVIEDAPAAPLAKKPARKIDEDDYDESEDEEEEDSFTVSPLKSKSTVPAINLTPSAAAFHRGLSSSSTPASAKVGPPAAGGKTTEEARKKLEEDAKATEDAAKRSFHTLFYTLENDKDAMLEQKKLQESEHQVDIEMSANGVGGGTAHGGTTQQGTLSQTNLGASSLALKNLIRVIDSNRDRVPASDPELRTLFSDVRKGRGKWASEDKVNQEELYEAAETVLNQLRGSTEHSGPFLTRVNKKEAPDYYNVIKSPMDLGTMTKKLKSYQYKSKDDFVSDLNLIWANCLKYNANPDHPLRKKALVMRKETEKLVPLIPNVTVKDRAQVEAEERRAQHGDAALDDDEDSDDEPIIAARGRKAPGKKSKKGTAARKAPADAPESSPVPTSESKPSANHLVPNGLGSNLKNEHLRAESESVADGSHLSTPPPGTVTPAGANGVLGYSTQTDAMDIDGDSAINGIVPSDGAAEEVENEDPEYQIWKQVTKKDRALVTAERHALFKEDRLDPEHPALRRTKQGMRSWLRKQKQAVGDGAMGKNVTEAQTTDHDEAQPSGETLAEGMQVVEEERLLPDYYDTMAAIPDISSRLKWIEDSEGNVVDSSEEFLRIIPKGMFTAPDSNLTRKISENLRQIQSTRKVASKIGIVKQMQAQSQMYQGQFQKHEPAPFVEMDVDPHVMTEEGPPIAPAVCRAALQRSAAEVLVHAGFEEFQPSALDAITDLAGDYFTRLLRTLNGYTQAPQVAVPVPGGNELLFKERFTSEECILHALQENGADLEALDSYVTEDVERAGTRLAATHDRMKAHLAESLRPALVDAGPDGSNAFNDDSEQFVGGDFAEELGEDFFGFKDLGIDVGGLSVPLHLLQNRMRNSNQAQNASSLSSAPVSDLPVPPSLTPITIDSVKNQIGLVQNFFLAKLHANNDQPLVEDDDLPLKQRFPKPRLGANGKITSPRKRPVKEQGPGKGHPRKKMKLNDGEAKETGKENEPNGANKEGENPKVNGDKDDKPNGTHESEPSDKPLTNGVSEEHRPPDAAQDENMTVGTPTPKGKAQQREIEGGMISPESLEAT